MARRMQAANRSQARSDEAETFSSAPRLHRSMASAALEVLRTHEAMEFWTVFARGRTDLPHVTPAKHLDRYLAMPPDEQRTYVAAKVNDRIVACLRLTPGSIPSPTPSSSRSSPAWTRARA